MTSKLGLILLAFVVLSMATGCNDTGSDTSVPTVEPTAQVITGDTAADAIIEDTQDAVEIAVSTACKLCLLAESADNCTGVCGSAETEGD